MAEQERFVPDILVGPSILEQKDVDAVNRLMKQLSDSAQDINRNKLTDILCQPNFRIIIFKDPGTDEVIGMASLYYYKAICAPLGIGKVEDVVIDKRYRGKGLGDLLVKYLISLSKSLKLQILELTSDPDNPERLPAIELYKKHGFKERGGYFYLDL